MMSTHCNDGSGRSLGSAIVAESLLTARPPSLGGYGISLSLFLELLFVLLSKKEGLRLWFMV